jgi:cytochrome b involved in lipid metabolism
MKYILLLLTLFSVILLTGCTDATEVKNDIAIATGAQSSDTTDSRSIEADTSSSTKTTTVSKSELVSHDKETDCWISYQGLVYDVTDYVPMHPGGAAQIIPLCGTSEEFENAFTVQHGNSKVRMLERMGVYKGLLE